jgi:hypothetical protein
MPWIVATYVCNSLFSHHKALQNHNTPVTAHEMLLVILEPTNQ